MGCKNVLVTSYPQDWKSTSMYRSTRIHGSRLGLGLFWTTYCNTRDGNPHTRVYVWLGISDEKDALEHQHPYTRTLAIWCRIRYYISEERGYNYCDLSEGLFKKKGSTLSSYSKSQVELTRHAFLHSAPPNKERERRGIQPQTPMQPHM